MLEVVKRLFSSRTNEIKKSYEHEFMAIPSYVSGKCISNRSINGFLAQSRFTPGLVEIFQLLCGVHEFNTIQQEGLNPDHNGFGSTIMKLWVPQKYIDKRFDVLFEG